MIYGLGMIDALAKDKKPVSMAVKPAPEVQKRADPAMHKTKNDVPVSDPFITHFFQQTRPQVHSAITEQAQAHRFQVLVTEVKASPKNNSKPTLIRHAYRIDEEYLYPASTIKIFASLGALLYWKDLKKKHPLISIESPLIFGKDGHTSGETHDLTNLSSGRITLLHELRKIHLVSSNFAYNRLYDLAGHAYLNRLFRASFPSLRLRHRLSRFEDEDIRRKTPPMTVEVKTKTGLGPPDHVRLPGKQSAYTFPKNPYAASTSIGVAYIDPMNGDRVDEPMDFSTKNTVSLTDLQNVLIAIRFPELSPLVLDHTQSPMDGWLTELRNAMSIDPAQSKNPVYSGPNESELRFKRMLSGLLDSGVNRDDLVYMNKGGKAYGFHLENAYLEHKKTGRALFITFGIYTNPNGVLNDNLYGYTETSEPLFHDLGLAAGRYLLKTR